MKKMLMFALCVATAVTAGAQKQSVDAAAKMSGKVESLSDARQLIQQALSNAETANDVRTYYVGGKLEFDAYDNLLKIRMINPGDARLDPIAMGNQLLNGYEMFMAALPLDSVPNEKGQVKPKYSKDITSKINGHFTDYFESGANFFNNKKYYPEAYNAFMIYGELPSKSFATKAMVETPDSVLATAFFNAGLAAYSGNQVDKSAAAFKKAREAGYTHPESYIYEIACWQNISNNDSTRVDEAKNAIAEAAMAGYQKFGLAQPLFVNNMVNALVTDGKVDEALALLNQLIAENPDNAAIYGLRGYVNDRAKNNEASEADYRKAASLPNVDFETLKNAAKKIFRIGTEKWNLLEGNSAEVRAERQNVKANYFEAAKAMTDQAKAMNPNDSDLQYVIENIDYALETFFQ